MGRGVERMEGNGMSELGLLTNWVPGALSGVNTLRGVELESRNLFLDQFYAIVMLFLWMLAFVAKIFLSILPSVTPLPILTNLLQKISEPRGEFFRNWPEKRSDVGHQDVKLSNSAIGRALTQVLALVNDIPASSNKYAFLQSLADKVIEENKVEGEKYKSINQAALGTGFARTMTLLGQSLQGRRQQETWLGRLSRLLPTGAFLPNIALLAPLVKVRSRFGQILSSFNPWTLSPDISGTVCPTNVTDTDMAEKFAKELLWMAEKLLDCGGMEEAIQQWSAAPSLAELSLCASPRVQKSLVRLSALLCRGLVSNTNIHQDVCLKLVVRWLPLLCAATHGGDGPIFSSLEKGDAEKLLEQAILALPEADQELILHTWLQEYALSQSDWPNLLNCYSIWCHATRKLEHVATEVIN